MNCTSVRIVFIFSDCFMIVSVPFCFILFCLFLHFWFVVSIFRFLSRYLILTFSKMIIRVHGASLICSLILFTSSAKCSIVFLNIPSSHSPRLCSWYNISNSIEFSDYICYIFIISFVLSNFLALCASFCMSLLRQYDSLLSL